MCSKHPLWWYRGDRFWLQPRQIKQTRLLTIVLKWYQLPKHSEQAGCGIIRFIGLILQAAVPGLRCVFTTTTVNIT